MQQREPADGNRGLASKCSPEETQKPRKRAREALTRTAQKRLEAFWAEGQKPTKGPEEAPGARKSPEKAPAQKRLAKKTKPRKSPEEAGKEARNP